MRHLFYSALGLSVALFIGGCSEPSESESQPAKEEMLLYIGITMVNPIKEIAERMEEELGINIVISQGGSQDLYDSLSYARRGDIYMPGSASYRERNLRNGLLGDFVHVGYNQAALLVPKGNPKQLTADLNQLVDPDLNVIICSPDTGSIGRETKRILTLVGLYEAVTKNAAQLLTDSRNLNRALKSGDADVILNWRATAFFDDNIEQIDVIDLPPEIAVPKKLTLNLLTFSKMPEKGRRFMEYAISPHGQQIFRKFGFLDREMQQWR